MARITYVTYTKTSLTGTNDRKFAVACTTDTQARDIASDLHYRLGCSEIKIQESGIKLAKDVEVIPYDCFKR